MAHPATNPAEDHTMSEVASHDTTPKYNADRAPPDYDEAMELADNPQSRSGQGWRAREEMPTFSKRQVMAFWVLVGAFILATITVCSVV